MKIVTTQQMRMIEQRADAAGLSYETMMLNAGRAIATWVYQHECVLPGVIGLIGAGNNGGDTLIALTELGKRGCRTIGFLVKPREKDPLITAYLSSGGAIIDLSERNNYDVLKSALIPDGIIVLDGILGTGFKMPLRDDLQDTMVEIHRLIKSRPTTRVIAVDCPSGVDCDTGEMSDVAIIADETLCLAAVKKGLLQYPAREAAGNITGLDIGIERVFQAPSKDYPEMITPLLVREKIPARQSNGHKGTFGTCLVIAGSAPYTGAAYLTGKAAYRAGCGLVHMASVGAVQKSLAGELIEAVWTTLSEVEEGYYPQAVAVLKGGLLSASSLVLGPGWGLAEGTRGFLEALLANIPSELPTLFDADGLKLLAQIDLWWEKIPPKSVLTPHPGEMAVLTGLSVEEIQADRWAVARAYADRWQTTLLLKGAVSVIADFEGHSYVNPIADSSLATAGSGDVLSGMIGGLMAQGRSPIEAAIAGVWIHTQAGRIARQRLGTDVSVTAMDILARISNAFAEI